MDAEIPRTEWLFTSPKSHSLRIGDFDGDGSWTSLREVQWEQMCLHTANSSGSRERTTVRSLVSTPVWIINTGDFDNDGALDLMTLTEDGVTIWRGNVHWFSADRTHHDDWVKSAKVASVCDSIETVTWIWSSRERMRSADCQINVRKRTTQITVGWNSS